MAKMPMVIPNNERNVLSLFPRREPKANEKLSRINLVNSMSFDLKSKNSVMLFSLYQVIAFCKSLNKISRTKRYSAKN